MQSGALTVLSTSPCGMSLPEEARQLRRDIAEALFRAGGGHYGGCLSVVDILLVLYRRFIRLSVPQKDHPKRDRLVLSKGHSALALYAVLNRIGMLDVSLSNYGEPGSPLTSHPDMARLAGIDFSTGSLGQGLSVGVGMAIACPDSTIWVILGDGECQEGQVWEAAMLGARRGLSNLVAIVDCNGFQECAGRYDLDLKDGIPVEALDEKWGAFRWQTERCNGNDVQDLEETIGRARRQQQGPTVILAQTKKGYGVSLLEQDPYRFHCTAVTNAEHDEIMGSLR